MHPFLPRLQVAHPQPNGDPSCPQKTHPSHAVLHASPAHCKTPTWSRIQHQTAPPAIRGQPDFDFGVGYVRRRYDAVSVHLVSDVDIMRPHANVHRQCHAELVTCTGPQLPLHAFATLVACRAIDDAYRAANQRLFDAALLAAVSHAPLAS